MAIRFAPRATEGDVRRPSGIGVRVPGEEAEHHGEADREKDGEQHERGFARRRDRAEPAADRRDRYDERERRGKERARSKSRAEAEHARREDEGRQDLDRGDGQDERPRRASSVEIDEPSIESHADDNEEDRDEEPMPER